MFLKKCHIISLGSQQTTEINEFLLKNVVATCWTHQIALCHQPCHGGFTVKITGSPNMVCTVNHAMEDLQWRLLILQIWFVWSIMPRRIYMQHRILDYSKYCSLHCHMQMEREERLRWQREQYKTRRERETEEQRESRLARRRWRLNIRHLRLIHRHVFTPFTHARTIVFQLLDM